MMRFYSTSEAARLAGIAPSSARNYTRDERLRPHFSPQAAASSGKARQFTTDDCKLLAYIGEQSRLGATVDDIAAKLQRGEQDTFPWQEPTDDPQSPQEATGSDSSGEPITATDARTAIVLVSAVKGFTDMIETQLAEARENERALAEQLAQARERIASLETELRIRSERPQTLWQRLFGR